MHIHLDITIPNFYFVHFFFLTFMLIIAFLKCVCIGNYFNKLIIFMGVFTDIIDTF